MKDFNEILKDEYTTESINEAIVGVPFSIKDLENAVKKFKTMSKKDIEKIYKETGTHTGDWEWEKGPRLIQLYLGSNEINAVYDIKTIDGGDGSLYISWNGKKFDGEF